MIGNKTKPLHQQWYTNKRRETKETNTSWTHLFFILSFLLAVGFPLCVIWTFMRFCIDIIRILFLKTYMIVVTKLAVSCAQRYKNREVHDQPKWHLSRSCASICDVTFGICHHNGGYNGPAVKPPTSCLVLHTNSDIITVVYQRD